jgi:hypothetical protein
MDVEMDNPAGLRITALALGFCLLCNPACAAPNVINLGAHADTFIAPAINAVVGSGVVDAAIYIDYTPDFNSADPFNPNPPAGDTFSVATGAQVSHAPYGVANLSCRCSVGEGDDARYYQVLHDTNAIVSTTTALQSGGGFLPDGTPPPTYNTATSSPNSGNGGTGWGIEFGLSSGYLGLDTSEDSWNSAAMAGFLAALAYRHSSWSWFDVKAALRQTASNWHAGYSHTAYGYGFIDWNAANAIASPGALYLQPPGLQIDLTDTTADLTLYPFRQTRRHHEEIYSIDPAYSWPPGRNEMTTADLAAARATLLYSSNSTDVIPKVSIPRVPIWIAAFTTDGTGHYSRFEEFSPRQIAPIDLPLPWWVNLVLPSSFLAWIRSRPTQPGAALA